MKTQIDNSARMNYMAQLKPLVDAAPVIECEECGNSIFIEGVILKRVSQLSMALLSPGITKDLIVPITVYSCTQCGHINSEFMKSAGVEEAENDESTENTPESTESENEPYELPKSNIITL